MKASGQWCVDQVNGQAGYRLCRFSGSGKSGASYSFAEPIETDRPQEVCRGSIHLVFSPDEFHLFSASFPKIKPELLRMQEAKRFRDLGLTLDSVAYVHRSRDAQSPRGMRNCIFIEESEIDQQLRLLALWQGIKKARLIPAVAAVAGLIRAVTETTVLVLLLGRSSSRVLAVRNGTPLYSQTLTQGTGGEIEEALIPNAIDFARLSLRKEHEINEFRIVTLGENRHLVDLAALGIDEWQPDFSQVLKTAGEGEIKDHPLLYGAPFSDPAFDFLPSTFARSWQLQSFSRTLGIAALVGCLALAAGWFALQNKLQGQEQYYRSQLEQLSTQNAQLQERLPANLILNNFNRLVAIRDNFAKTFRLNDLARILSVTLPEHVHVASLILKQEAPETGGPAMALVPLEPPADDPAAMEAGSGEQLSVAEQLQQKSPVIDLTCISQGTHLEVSRRFEETISALKTYFGVHEINRNYREQEARGELRLGLIPPGRGVNQ